MDAKFCWLGDDTNDVVDLPRVEERPPALRKDSNGVHQLVSWFVRIFSPENVVCRTDIPFTTNNMLWKEVRVELSTRGLIESESSGYGTGGYSNYDYEYLRTKGGIKETSIGILTKT